MQQCPNCNHRNRLGVVFCENCGASLIGNSPISTKSLGGDNALPEATEVAVATTGESVLTDSTLLRIEIEGSNEPILLKPGPEVILGRRDPTTGAMPDVDLTQFAGYRMGVSRRHAALRPGEGRRLDLWDLGSSNGTFLNGTRLGAHRPYRLRDGDEIRLGQMLMRLYFHLPQAAGVTPAPADTTKPSKPNLSAAKEAVEVDDKADKVDTSPVPPPTAQSATSVMTVPPPAPQQDTGAAHSDEAAKPGTISPLKNP
ncbi:MAG: FHA domain-containing protein [Aggregatilineales bacterium]